MEKNNKRIIYICLLIIIISILSFPSMAFFTIKKTTTDSFYIASYENGKSYSNADNFSIHLYQFDENGLLIERNNTLDYIYPGSLIKKQAVVKNTGEIDQYVRVIITITNYKELRRILNEDIECIFETFNDEFIKKEEYEIDDSYKIVYYLDEVLNPNCSKYIYKNIVIPNFLSADDMSVLDRFSISLVAQAIQSNDVGDSSFQAFKNFWATKN